MNERIKELAEQAGFFPELNWDHTDWHAAGHSDLFEKFAEMIVRECTDICRSDDWEDQQGWGKMYAHKIQKHFGIKP